MLEESRRQILESLGDGELVLDVGAWAKPFPRADWVLDLQPYETRGLYGYGEDDRASERFRADTWVCRDICDRGPWPFSDGQFDFVICSHTLEDIRDPVWVCSELQRVGRAGYIEVPSRVEEQSVGVDGDWPGWAHHRWLCDVDAEGIQFVHKSHFLRAGGEYTMDGRGTLSLPLPARRSTLWWEGGFSCREKVLLSEEEMREYLAQAAPRQPPRRSLRRRISSALNRASRRPA
jgi:hypothetical protein